MFVLFLILAAAVIAYLVSCALHPYIACETCEGKGKHVGALFPKASRPCHKCSGTGQKQRLGVRFLGRGKPRKSSSRIAPRSSSFKSKQ